MDSDGELMIDFVLISVKEIKKSQLMVVSDNSHLSWCSPGKCFRTNSFSTEYK